MDPVAGLSPRESFTLRYTGETPRANHSPAIDVLSQRRCEIFSFRKHLKQLSAVTSEMIVNLLLNTLK